MHLPSRLNPSKTHINHVMSIIVDITRVLGCVPLKTRLVEMPIHVPTLKTSGRLRHHELHKLLPKGIGPCKGHAFSVNL